jgi:hypothetical protein
LLVCNFPGGCHAWLQNNTPWHAIFFIHCNELSCLQE